MQINLPEKPFYYIPFSSKFFLFVCFTGSLIACWTQCKLLSLALGSGPPHRARYSGCALPDSDVNVASLSYTLRCPFLRPTPGSSSHLLLLPTRSPSSTQTASYTMLHSFPTSEHCFLFYLLNIPSSSLFHQSQAFWRPFLTIFPTKEPFPNSFSHLSFTYCVLPSRTYISHVRCEWLLRGTGAQS